MGAPRALVTGCGPTGLGRAISEALAETGWEVVAACRNEERVTQLSRHSPAPGIRAVALDVSDDAAIEALAGGMGDRPLDLLVSNAAHARREPTLADVERRDWLRALEVNAFAALALARAFAPLLRQAERPRFVAIGSSMGSIAAADEGGRYSYRSSKAALNMAVRILAADRAMAGIVCVSVHPGWVRTKLGGEDAPTTPQAAARRLVELAAQLGPEQSGRFLDASGEALPW